jgi:hypothetical protein
MFVRTYNQAHPTSLEFVLFNTGHRLHSECQHHIGCGGKEDSVGCHEGTSFNLFCSTTVTYFSTFFNRWISTYPSVQFTGSPPLALVLR